MFFNREDAGHQLAQELKKLDLRDPLVLAIPRGGVVVGAVLARELDAELDVVLSRKLRALAQPELAIGAVSEDGQVYLNHQAEEVPGVSDEYLAQERHHQLDEIARRQKLFRAVRPPAQIAGHSVIVTDDGIATGSTMIATLPLIRSQSPHELIVAVPVASADRLEAIRTRSDRVVCLLVPRWFRAISEFYLEFEQVDDQQVVELLRECCLVAELASREAQH